MESHVVLPSSDDLREHSPASCPCIRNEKKLHLSVSWQILWHMSGLSAWTRSSTSASAKSMPCCMHGGATAPSHSVGGCASPVLQHNPDRHASQLPGAPGQDSAQAWPTRMDVLGVLVVVAIADSVVELVEVVLVSVSFSSSSRRGSGGPGSTAAGIPLPAGPSHKYWYEYKH